MGVNVWGLWNSTSRSGIFSLFAGLLVLGLVTMARFGRVYGYFPDPEGIQVETDRMSPADGLLVMGWFRMGYLGRKGASDPGAIRPAC